MLTKFWVQKRKRTLVHLSEYIHGYGAFHKNDFLDYVYALSIL